MEILNTINFSKLHEWDIKRTKSVVHFFRYPQCRLSKVLSKADVEWVNIEDDKEYPLLGVHAHGEGVYINKVAKGKELTMRAYQKSQSYLLFYCKVRTVNGQWGIVYPQFEDSYGSSNMQYLKIEQDLLSPIFLENLLKVKRLTKEWDKNAIGANGRHFPLKTLLSLEIPLPTRKQQDGIVAKYNQTISDAKSKEKQAGQLENAIEQYLLSTLGIKQNTQEDNSHLEHLHITNYKQLSQWGYDYLLWNGKSILESTLYPNVLLSKLMDVNPQTSFSSLDKDNDVSFVPMECVSDAYGELKERKVVKVSQSKGFTKFQNGDLIWARITPCMQNGKSAIVDNLQNGFGCGSTEFHVLRKFSSEVMTEYVYCLLRTHCVLEDAKRYFTGSAGQQRVPRSYLQNLAIPLPLIDIQKEIVSNILKMKSQIKSLKQQASDLRKKALSDFENEIFE